MICPNPKCQREFVPKCRTQRTCGNSTCRQVLWRAENRERYKAEERAREESRRALAARPQQEPLVPAHVWRRWEAIESEHLDFEHMMEAEETAIGKSLKGRVGTSMRGQGGILHWAQPLYRAAKTNASH